MLHVICPTTQTVHPTLSIALYYDLGIITSKHIPKVLKLESSTERSLERLSPLAVATNQTIPTLSAFETSMSYKACNIEMVITLRFQ